MKYRIVKEYGRYQIQVPCLVFFWQSLVDGNGHKLTFDTIDNAEKRLKKYAAMVKEGRKVVKGGVI